jgi:predicted  nucleic acid-binding Zn-ribbon protein
MASILARLARLEAAVWRLSQELADLRNRVKALQERLRELRGQ